MTGIRGKATPLKTKSIYEPGAPDDGFRMLITRYYPRGVKGDRFDLWVRELSPSSSLLHRYKDGKIRWNGFVRYFVSELRSSQASRDALLSLAQRSRRGDVTLLCYEEEGERCHRQVVKEIVRDPALLASVTTGGPARGTRTPQTSRERFYPRRKVGRKARK